jgi:hypothetical protein
LVIRKTDNTTTKRKDRLNKDQKEGKAIQRPKGRTGYTMTKRKDRLSNDQKEGQAMQ